LKVEKGKIVEASEAELFVFYLSRGWDDIMSFTEFLRRCRAAGTTVKEESA